MKKKLISIGLVLTMILSFAACNAKTNTNSADKKYTIGICQSAQHPALDAATKGFMDAVNEAMPGQVTFDNQNASGDINQCGVICTGFVANNVDLILANATPSLQAAATATVDIPILGTAVTEYGVALEIPDFNGTVGGNISGTADLAPLDQQAAMVKDFFPEAKNVGILFCSAEPNSKYQADVVKTELEKNGLQVKLYTFADSNDVSAVTTLACSENDVLYIPTDNTAATCAQAINNIAETANVPIIAGEESICRACGVSTLTIDYYELGRTTGQMAVEILKGEKEISSMPIQYFENPIKKVNTDKIQAFGLSIPEGYVEIEK